MHLVTVEGQVVAGNPVHLAQAHIKGMVAFLLDVLAKLRAGQFGERYPKVKVFSCLPQGAVNVWWRLQGAVDVVVPVIESNGPAVKKELLIQQVAFGVNSQPVGAPHPGLHVYGKLEFLAALKHLVIADLGFVGKGRLRFQKVAHFLKNLVRLGNWSPLGGLGRNGLLLGRGRGSKQQGQARDDPKENGSR